jgi:site-specific DNA recombinase
MTEAKYRATVENNGDRVRVAVYIRVSTDEQSKSGYSIPEQKRELLTHAERQGWLVVDIIEDDGHSGAVGIRPGLDRIMEMAEAGEIDVVLAKKRNRLFRSRYYRLMYEKDLRELGVRMVALDDTGNRFADAMNDEFNDWFREEVRKNTIAGRMEKAREGS